jgi:hypothetical protein
MAQDLIFYFAGLAISGIFLIGFADIAAALRPVRENEKTPINYVMYLGKYLFALFFLATVLQINIDFSSVASDLTLVPVYEAIAGLLLFGLLVGDLLNIFKWVVEWINKRR